MNPNSSSYRSFVLTFCLIITSFLGSAQAPKAERAILDATTWDFTKDRLALNGDWTFHENQLLTPAELSAAPPGRLMYFPKLWNDHKLANEPDTEFGTYSLNLLVPDQELSLAVEIPQIYSSYRLWVNGNLIAENGLPGSSREQTKPQWMPQTVTFKSHGESIQIVLQIANFYHFKSGSKDPIYIGGSEMMEHQRRIATSSNLMEAIILAITGLIFLVLWQSDRKAIILYFTLLCFTWALRSVFSNLYLFISFFPDFNWSLMVRIEYITLYLTMIWAILFLNKLFPLDGKIMAKYLLVGVNVLFVMCTLFFSPLFFTRLLPIYLSFCGFLLIYGVFIIVRAWVNEHAGVWFSIFSILMGLLIFTYDMFAYEGFFAYNPVIFGMGYVIIFLFMATSLLLHLNILKSKPRISVLTYNDLYKDRG